MAGNQKALAQKRRSDDQEAQMREEQSSQMGQSQPLEQSVQVNENDDLGAMSGPIDDSEFYHNIAREDEASKGSKMRQGSEEEKEARDIDLGEDD